MQVSPWDHPSLHLESRRGSEKDKLQVQRISLKVQRVGNEDHPQPAPQRLEKLRRRPPARKHHQCQLTAANRSQPQQLKPRPQKKDHLQRVREQFQQNLRNEEQTRWDKVLLIAAGVRPGEGQGTLLGFLSREELRGNPRPACQGRGVVEILPYWLVEEPRL